MAGPRTWMLARELYLSGLTAREVAERIGVTVHAIRQRITREGWTKTAHADLLLGPATAAVGGAARPAAATLAPPSCDGGPDDGAAPDPVELAHEVGRRAARALADGRMAEASALARTGEQVLAFLAGLPEPIEAERDPHAAGEMWRRDVWTAAERLAGALLKDGHTPAIHSRAAFRWRAENLGPEAAEHDRRTAEAGGWAASVYDETGAVRPPESFEDFRRRF